MVALGMRERTMFDYHFVAGWVERELACIALRTHLGAWRWSDTTGKRYSMGIQAFIVMNTPFLRYPFLCASVVFVSILP